MSDWDKDLIAKAFLTPGNDNLECTILVATDAYGMGIDNLDIKLVIQWDMPITFDAMDQRLGRAGRKGGQSIFILFTPKWTQVKDPKEIEERNSQKIVDPSTNIQLSNTNRPKRSSPLVQITLPDTVSDTESIADSNAGVEVDAEGEINDSNLLSALLAIEGETEKKKKSAKQQANKTDIQKRANLSDEIFNYIHNAPCRRLFSLAWYDDMTYAADETTGLAKALPIPCCNGPSCNSAEPEFLQREPFINTLPTKYTEADQEWIAYRTAALKNWRKETSERMWKEEGVNKPMPHSLIMSDNCLLALAKNADLFVDAESLIQFLVPWYGMKKHHVGILECLQSIRSGNNDAGSRLERKAALQSARTSKKIKYMDDPVIAEAARITALRDQQLIQRGKPSAGTKARIKKAAEVEKKEKEKADKAREKNQQRQDIRRLAIANCQVEFGAFQGVLSDPLTEASSDPPEALPEALIIQTPATKESQASARTAHQAGRKKKKDISLSMGQRLLNHKKALPPHIRATTPPVQMELIRPGKRKVKVTANAVENIPPKRMRQLTD